MKRLWKRQWLLLALALAVFLSVGAVALAAATDDGQAVAADRTVLTAAGKPGPLDREALKEKKEQWIQRQKALMQLVREKMTPEDQAAYDRLVETAKDKREALNEAREALKATLKELRDLTNKYLGAGDEAAGAAGAVSGIN